MPKNVIFTIRKRDVANLKWTGLDIDACSERLVQGVDAAYESETLPMEISIWDKLHSCFILLLGIFHVFDIIQQQFEIYLKQSSYLESSKNLKRYKGIK